MLTVITFVIEYTTDRDFNDVCISLVASKSKGYAFTVDRATTITVYEITRSNIIFKNNQLLTENG